MAKALASGRKPIFRRELFAESPLTLAVCIALAIALFIGGGGAEMPARNGFVQAIGAILVGLLIGAHFAGRRVFALRDAPVIAMIVLLVALMLFQLVPLDPLLFTSTPAQLLAESTRVHIGQEGTARPLSLNPEGTMRALTALAFPAAILLFMLKARREEVRLLVYVIVAGALISALLGFLQVALGNPAALQVNPIVRGAGPGLFANPNHQGTLMALGIVLAGLLLRTMPAAKTGRRAFSDLSFMRIGLFVVMILLVLGAIASGSRAGLWLSLLALPIGIILAGGWGSSIRLGIGLGVAALVVVALLAMVPSTNAFALRQAIYEPSDIRFKILEDLFFTLSQALPLGTGFNSFVPVFASYENLDHVVGSFVNHAHNDVLEFMIEGGLAGTIWLAVAALSLIATLVWSLFKGGENLPYRFAGGACLAIVLLQSLVDYPARMESIAAVSALAIGLILCRPHKARAAPQATGKGKMLWMAGFAVLALPVAFKAVQLGIAQQAVRAQAHQAALAINPDHPVALADAADQALRLEKFDEARALAIRGLNASPINVKALRVLAMTNEATGNPTPEAWRTAASLGWRDGPAQVWALRQSLIAGELPTAAIRADAALRTGSEDAFLLRAIRTGGNDESFRGAIVPRLILYPEWRRDLFRMEGEIEEREVAGSAQIIAAMFDAGAEISPEEMRPTLRQLIDLGRFDVAHGLYERLPVDRSERDQLLRDGGFDQDPALYYGSLTPFDWYFRNNDRGVAAIDDPYNPELTIEGFGQGTVALVERTVRLPAGSYVLQFDAHRATGDAEAVEIQLRCAGRSGPIATQDLGALTTSEPARQSISFATGADCPLVMISIVAKAFAEPVVQMDNFRIVRASRTRRSSL